ncbi:hypothetical protein Tco_0353141 [Tanacetum coccineum]
MNKVDELRAVSCHIFGASRVQIPEHNLDNLKMTRDEDGDFDTVDPQCLLGFEMLEGLDPKIPGSLLKSTDFATLVFLRYILISGLGVVIDFEVFSLRGSTLVEVILIKGHMFPTIVKVIEQVAVRSGMDSKVAELVQETDITQRTKNKAKNDKTKHGLEMCEKTKPTVKVRVNSEKLKQKI